MEVLLVRHGQSVGNREGRMQGHQDFPLSDTGRAQAKTLAAWLREREIGWDIAYASPLARARETAEIMAAELGLPEPIGALELREIRAGELEGLTRDDILARHPAFMDRAITDLGDFAEFGGESYDEVQARVRGWVDKLEREHRAPEQRVLVVAHGGINFQILKTLICEPVPRVCIVRMGNCSATLVRMRERRGVYMGEVVWHVPLELVAPQRDPGADTSRIFR
jgi:probable phosphoglycerate mutase